MKENIKKINKGVMWASEKFVKTRWVQKHRTTFIVLNSIFIFAVVAYLLQKQLILAVNWDDLGDALATAVAKLFVTIGDGLRALISGAFGVSLDSIISGCTETGMTASHNLNFTFNKGNVPGMIACALYSVVAVIAFIAIPVYILYLFMKAAWAKSGESLARVKDALVQSIILIGAIALTPRIVQVIFDLRDSAFQVVQQVPELFGAEGSVGDTIFDTYKSAATNDGSIAAGIFYIGLNILTFMFAFIYASITVKMVIIFGFFGLIMIMSFSNRGLLVNWYQRVIVTSLTPVVDVALLVVPALMCSAGLTFPALLFCMVLTNARGVLAEYAGGGETGAEGGRIFGGLLAMGGMLAARAASGKGKGGANEQEPTTSDEENAAMYNELAGGEAGGMASADADFGGPAAITEGSQMNGMVSDDSLDMSGNVAPLSAQDNGEALVRGSNGPDTVRLGNNAYMTGSRSSIMAKYATERNFDQKEMRGVLSDREMASAYASRAQRSQPIPFRNRNTQDKLATVASRTAKYGGALIGGAVGFGAAAFVPTAAPAAAYLGTNLGRVGGVTSEWTEEDTREHNNAPFPVFDRSNNPLNVREYSTTTPVDTYGRNSAGGDFVPSDPPSYADRAQHDLNQRTNASYTERSRRVRDNAMERIDVARGVGESLDPFIAQSIAEDAAIVESILNNQGNE